MLSRCPRHVSGLGYMCGGKETTSLLGKDSCLPYNPISHFLPGDQSPKDYAQFIIKSMFYLMVGTQ